jgi:hypothetical protein
MSREVGIPAPPFDYPSGSHSDASSTMVASTVKFGGNDGLSATQPAAPSPAGPTRTSEPLPTAAPDPDPVPTVRRSGPTQPRDPER